MVFSGPDGPVVLSRNFPLKVLNCSVLERLL